MQGEGGGEKQLARDAIAFTLGYFDGDYQSASGLALELADPDGLVSSGAPSLFNGNIRNMTLSHSDMQLQTLGWLYHYDQLNRYKSRQALINPDQNSWAWNQSTSSLTNKWMESEANYDANGNIQNFKRYDETGSLMDDLVYDYPNANNKLDYVSDLVLGSSPNLDIESGQAAGNYQYDEIGNLIQDGQENLIIEWTHSGKVKSVSSLGPNAFSLTFEYDPMGNRVAKHYHPIDPSQQDVSTWYIRDASGNVMTTYSLYKTSGLSYDFYIDEWTMYGSKRLGVVKPGVKVGTLSDGLWSQEVDDAPTPPVRAGLKYYELCDHLGNVLAVVNDVSTFVNPTPMLDGDEYALPNIINSQDYYAFGSLMEGRANGTERYRYGFNGQERTDDVKGVGNHNTALYWEYDTRLGRRWNLDPKPNPSLSLYAINQGNPIWYSDRLGDTVQVSFRAGGFLGLRMNTLNYNGCNLLNRDGSNYMGKVPNFGQQVLNALDKLSVGHEGNAALSELISSRNVFKIERTNDKNSFVANSISQAGLGLIPNLPSGFNVSGSGGTIYFNPNISESGINTRGITGRPTFIGLGHELLGHGISANRGLADYSSLVL